MAGKADKWIIVKNLGESIGFYQEVLGFKVNLLNKENGVAMALSPSQQSVLITEKKTEEELKDYLAPVFDKPEPGKCLYFGGSDLKSYREKVSDATKNKTSYVNKEWGDENFTVEDPDGYILSFWGGRELSTEEVLDFYEEAPERLKRAIEGLTEEELDLARAPGKWTIRQIVLHIVDSDATSLAGVKFALAEPGRTLNTNSYDPDVWAVGLDYASRPIEAEVKLFDGIRSHISGLLRHFPDALERSVKIPEGTEVKVIHRIRPLMGHALHHIDQILETRKVHGISSKEPVQQ
ncbi:DinB family protein [Pseudalkalibacillus caeni]|uniref:Glyoxalase n=1 Tax=Exobacillus caeni TaxID=2574798 RepID=A0A5R9F7C8_9BACL|nr:DinB family protein [Pseudalkalibacillus caeni]TLS38170.1 glyoxalase [Pseudalkalibacillus caeni]